MKKYTPYIVILVCLACLSCKKEHAVKPGNTAVRLYPVSFSLSAFSQKQSGFGLTPTSKLRVNGLSPSLKDTIDVLYYNVYEPATRKVIRQFTQYSTAAGFGAIKDSIAAGSYVITIAGGKTGLLSSALNNLYNYDSNGTSSLSDVNFFYSSTLSYPLMTAWNDTFYKQFNMDVPAATAGVQQVSLDRIVSQVQVNLTDTIPANVASIDVVISNDYNSTEIIPTDSTTSYTIENFPYQAKYTAPVAVSQRGQPNFQITTYTINYFTPFTVTLNAYDAAGNRVAFKTITNVTCVKNMRTVLTGKLFNGTVTTGFGVTANQAWAAPASRGF